MLKVVRGDNFEFCIKIKNVDTILVNELWFYCKGLNINYLAIKDDEVFRIRVPCELTDLYRSGFYRYEIIATLMDGQRVTLEQGSMVEVVKRLDESG